MCPSCWKRLNVVVAAKGGTMSYWVPHNGQTGLESFLNKSNHHLKRAFCTLTHLQQVTQVSTETFGQTVQQLTERQVCAGGEGVAVGAKGPGKVGTSLQHREFSVLLHNATHLRQQQIQMLKQEYIHFMLH